MSQPTTALEGGISARDVKEGGVIGNNILSLLYYSLMHEAGVRRLAIGRRVLFFCCCCFFFWCVCVCVCVCACVRALARVSVSVSASVMKQVSGSLCRRQISWGGISAKGSKERSVI